MMKSTSILLSIALLFLVIAFIGHAAPLLENGGFELGSAPPWQLLGGAAIVAEQPRSGSYAGYLSSDQNSIQQTISGLLPNSAYRFTGWAKLASGSSGGVIIGVKDYGGPVQDIIIGEERYTQAEHIFFTGPTASSATVYCYRSGIGGAYCDDFELLPLAPPTPHEEMKLIWQDEFDGETLDLNHWGFELGYVRNNELQFYTETPKNVRVENGNLILEAHREAINGYEYSSGSIETLGKFTFTYGRVDVRAALPSGQGLWPAIWTLGENYPTVNWPDSGEIDIMEHVNQEELVYGSVHFEDAAGAHQSVSRPSHTFDVAQFHLYSIEWDENEIRWFIDDTPYSQVDISGPEMSEFHLPHFLKLNLAIGGDWPGPPDDQTAFPAQYRIDYVRVYAHERGSRLYLPFVK